MFFEEQLKVLQPCRAYENFKINLHMIHQWKGLDLEITDFKYQHDLTPSSGTIPSETLNP